MAFHTDHAHAPMRTGKAFIAAKQANHVSVANRLTVSRFRNLMSTAGGQRFLNENLHRTALLATHIQAMSSDTGLGGPNDAPAPAAPSSNPLYVSIRAMIADWEVSAEERKGFLVLDPRVAPILPKESANRSSESLMAQTHSSIRGSNA